ncbi:MAG TPA: 3-dehydroquinate synthase [Egibacteraceae bacterium]|nr:3-dehydroquinate synthase [Egibacteraceae bacterium]
MSRRPLERIKVALPGSPYDVVVGAGALDALGELAALPQAATRVALVTSPAVGALYAARAASALERDGRSIETIEISDGEDAKTLQTLERLYHRFAGIPLRRSDAVVALGGGVIGDLAGFAAATWNRGVALVQVPTTLLAQVDAAIGGKTGVNLPEGKNLVGAFHQPIAVIADTATLETLPARERRAGLGEIIKCGFILDPAILDLVERRPTDAVDGAQDLLTELVVRSVAVKARIVAADEREGGERAVLNYGHTVGHAIEALTGYDTYRHGEAVALGMVFAARLGERMGISQTGLAQRTETVLRAVGLPTGGVRLDPAEVWRLLARDKKTRAGARFVLCTEPGKTSVVDAPESQLVDEVLRTLA